MTGEGVPNTGLDEAGCEPIGFPTPLSTSPSVESPTLCSSLHVVTRTTAPPAHWGRSTSAAARRSMPKPRKGHHVAKGKRCPSAVKVEKGPSALKGERGSFAAKGERGPSAAKGGNGPSAARGERGPSAAKGTGPPALSHHELQQLQGRVDRALGPAPMAGARKLLTVEELETLDILARDLARAGETSAFVRVWDLSGGSAAASEETWAAVERLHARGKRRIPFGTLRIPPLERRTLSPGRRLHKIAKGRIMKNRSDAAHMHMDRALAWIEEQRENGRIKIIENGGAQARRKLVKELKRELGVPEESARGLVTKLKQKKALNICD